MAMEKFTNKIMLGASEVSALCQGLYFFNCETQRAPTLQLAALAVCSSSSSKFKKMESRIRTSVLHSNAAAAGDTKQSAVRVTDK